MSLQIQVLWDMIPLRSTVLPSFSWSRGQEKINIRSEPLIEKTLKTPRLAN